jgi:hypothetical protein
MNARATLLPLVLGLACGAGFAAWLTSSPAAPAHAATGSAATPTRLVTPPASAPAAPADATPDAAVSAPPSPGVGPQPAWRSLALVTQPSDAASKWVNIPVLRAKGPPAPPSPLNPEFAEFFGLNEVERATIETGLKTVIAEQSELDFQAARAIPITEADGFLSKYEFALVVDPYPEKGAALHDRMNTLLRETLGDERMAVYDSWSEASLLADWQGLGLSQRTLHIKRQNPGPYQVWDVNYEAKAPDGTRQQFNSMGTTTLADFDLLTNFPVSRWLEKHPLSDAPASPAK